jgi:hypothetical protein
MSTQFIIRDFKRKEEKEKATETNYSGFRRLKMQRTITVPSPSPNPYPLPSLPPGQNRSKPGRYKTLAKQLLKLRKNCSQESINMVG